MTILNLKGKFLKIEDLTRSTRLFTIELESEFDFKPGQFVNLSFEYENETYRKPYSIASTSNKNIIELCINLVPDGKATPKLFQKKEGDECKVMGPLGLFTLEQKEDKNKLVFIATGTGISPMRSMIQSLISDQKSKSHMIGNEEGIINNQEIILIFGTRYETDILFKNEFEKLQHEFGNFKYLKVISKPTENWDGRKGYVQDNFDIIDAMNSQVYICGLPKMIEDVNQKLLEMGMLQEDIHFEKYV